MSRRWFVHIFIVISVAYSFCNAVQFIYFSVQGIIYIPYFLANKPIFWTLIFFTNFLGSAYSANTPWTRKYWRSKCHCASIHSFFHYFAFYPTYLHFSLPYFALCTIGIRFAWAIKTDKLCVFCFKLPQNIVMPGVGLIWGCAASIEFSASAYSTGRLISRKIRYVE